MQAPATLMLGTVLLLLLAGLPDPASPGVLAAADEAPPFARSSAAAAAGDAACASAPWDTRADILAFRGAARPITAARDPASIPTITLGTLHEVLLAPQGEVRFAHEPLRRRGGAQEHAGMLQFEVAATGRYHVTLDVPAWIDVAGPGGVLAASAFMGRTDCTLFHKSVEFTLEAKVRYTLQLNGVAPESVKLVVLASQAAAAR